MLELSGACHRNASALADVFNAALVPGGYCGAHLNPFNPLSRVALLGIAAEAEVSIGATSTCGAAFTADAGSVAGIVVIGGRSGAGGGL